MQVIWLPAQQHMIGATFKVTDFGTRSIKRLLARYNASKTPQHDPTPPRRREGVARTEPALGAVDRPRAADPRERRFRTAPCSRPRRQEGMFRDSGHGPASILPGRAAGDVAAMCNHRQAPRQTDPPCCLIVEWYRAIQCRPAGTDRLLAPGSVARRGGARCPLRSTGARTPSALP